MVAMIRHTAQASAFLPDAIRAAIVRRIREVSGIALIVLALTGALALATWSVKDPSLTHATAAPVRNLLGHPGAAAADLLMPLFGVAAVALILPIGIWGWRLVCHHPLDRERWRVAVWVFAMVAAAGFASCLPASRAWPLPTGLGGVIGDALLRIPAALARAPLSGVTRITVATLLGALALLGLAFTMGFLWHRPATERDAEEAPPPSAEDEEERSSISLGWLYH